MSTDSLVTTAAARAWLAAHVHRRALARPLLVLVASGRAPAVPGAPTSLAAHTGVRRVDVVAQGRRVFTNWRACALVVDDVPTISVAELLLPLVPPAHEGDDAWDLVAFDGAAARVRALAVEHPLLGRAHHVLLANPRGMVRGAGDRWLAGDPPALRPPPLLFPVGPGRPALHARALARPPRVRTMCVARPCAADAAHVAVASRWREEPPEGRLDAQLPAARAAARWSRAHTTILLATLFARLAEIEAGSPAAMRA